MQSVCPKDATHKEFITTAHVMQDWLVDAHGNWIRTIDESVETSFGPNKDNTWTCAICGATADVFDN